MNASGKFGRRVWGMIGKVVVKLVAIKHTQSTHRVEMIIIMLRGN